MMDTAKRYLDTILGPREKCCLKAVDSIDVEKYAVVKKDMYELFKHRKNRNGCRFEIDPSLTFNGITYSCDSITASHCFKSRFILLDELKEDTEFEKRVKDFLWNTYCLGGETLFPANYCTGDARYSGQNFNSINQRRGCHGYVEDRFDVTLECIRRYYSDKKDMSYPMSRSFHLKPQMDFFDMFKNFNDFTEFFFFDDLVEDGKIIFFMEWDGKHPFPRDVDTYYRYLDNQQEFVKRRTRRIELYLKDRIKNVLHKNG